MHKIQIKPLSVNQAHRTVRGRILKSSAYRQYEKDLMMMLPSKKIPEGKIQLYLEAGLSSKLADIDNIAKPTIDILQKKYDFNDRMIYRLLLEKEIVKKGDEYISFRISEYIDLINGRLE